jgi:hypothetical protein
MGIASADDCPNALAQSQRSFVLDVIVFDGAMFVPEVKASRDRETNAKADQQKPPVGRQPDQGCRNDRSGNQQGSGASNGDRHFALPARSANGYHETFRGFAERR